MCHQINLDYIIFWSSIITIVVISHEANGILTDSNDLHCTHIQCPTKCPEDSYLKSSLDDEDDDFEDYDDEPFGHDSYIEEIGQFEELPPEEDLHDIHSPQHILKERQKREAFFQDDIEKCCDNQICICNNCEEVPKCMEGYVAVQIHEGQGVPGNCCSIFKCLKKEVCQLGMKQSWWTTKCRECSCVGESEFCLEICPEEEILQNCYSEYWQKPMMNGAYWKEGRCTTCSCEQGDRRCLTPVCPKLDCKEIMALEDECCPKCVNEEIDVRTEIVHHKEKDIKDVIETYSTESPTEDIFDRTDIHLFYYHNPQNHSNSSVVEENSSSQTASFETTSLRTEITETSTASVIPKIIEEISTTLQPKSFDVFKENLSSTEFATSTPFSYDTSSSFETTLSAILSSTEKPKSIAELEQGSSSPAIDTTTTEESKYIIEYEQESSAYTEQPKSTVTLDQDISTVASVTKLHTSLTPTTEPPEELLTEDTTNTDTSLANITQETSIVTVATTFIEKTATSEATTAAATLTASTTDTFTEPDNNFTTGATTEASLTSSIGFSTAAATETTTPRESTTTKTISSPTKDMTTNEEDSINETSNPTYTTTSMLDKYSTLCLTSTTSSPYSSIADSKTTSKLEEQTYKSSTTGPEPLKPLFQSYGDFNTNEGFPNSRKQMRIVFDEIDYVVIIVLFTGSVLCISLGLIIRHTKNRKKMYSSIPNSETSLSQTSTNTVLTV